MGAYWLGFAFAMIETFYIAYVALADAIPLHVKDLRERLLFGYCWLDVDAGIKRQQFRR